MQGFTDIHHHLIYGMDDGARTFEEAMAMATAAFADGTTTLAVTPHISPGIKPFDMDRYHRRLEKLQAACRKRGLNLRLLEGAEILYTDQTCRFLRDKRLPTLGGSDWVLVEFLPLIAYHDLCEALTCILRTGYRPVVAHVERYRCLAASIPHLQAAKQLGAILQMNCSTVLGGKGLLRDHRNRRLLDTGLIDIVATDAHNTTSRPSQMQAAYNWLAQRYGSDYAKRLTGCEYDKKIPQRC